MRISASRIKTGKRGERQRRQTETAGRIRKTRHGAEDGKKGARARKRKRQACRRIIVVPALNSSTAVARAAFLLGEPRCGPRPLYSSKYRNNSSCSEPCARRSSGTREATPSDYSGQLCNCRRITYIYRAGEARARLGARSLTTLIQ